MGLFTRKPKAATISVGGEYFGGHLAIKGYHKALTLTMTDAGIKVESGGKKDKKLLLAFRWSQVMGFDNERHVQAQGGGQRLTATRMATMGVFSLAAPKTTGQVETRFINVLHTTTGDVALEIELEGGAGSGIATIAANAIKKHSKKVRVFVAERACAPQT